MGLLVGSCTLGARDDADLSGGHGKDGGVGGGSGGDAGVGGGSGGDAGTCATGTKDCDGLSQNGCETAVSKDPKNCGACGSVCGTDGGLSAVCNDGKCGLSSCTAPLADCDGNGSCETDTSTSVDHCGFCEYKCALPNAKSSCAKGCQIDECNPGFESCDGIPSNGCETPLNTATNCGFCGTGCALANATASCDTGSCAITSCSPGFGDCDKLADTGCESNTLTDPGNCGSCGTQCATGQVCQAGKCVVSGCAPPTADCDSNPATCETNTDTSLAHCGFCNSPCSLPHATPACVGGKCTVSACQPGWGDCDSNPANGCETQLNTTTNCKSCGDQCSGGANVVFANCGAGGCQVTCTQGFSNCNAVAADGCEAQLATDPLHCGNCAKNCSVGAPAGTQPGCSAGQCTYNCGSGTADCDSNGSCETNLTTSAQNCGQCGRSCGPGGCSAGACVPEVMVAGSEITSVDYDYPPTSPTLVFGRNPGGVFRVSKSTKSVTTISTAQPSVWLDVAGSTVIFAHPTDGIYRVPTSGGLPNKIGSSPGVKQLDAWGGDVWYSTSSTPSVLSIDQGGGPTKTFDSQAGALGVTHESGDIFWTMPALGEVRRSDDNIVNKQTMASGQGEPSYIDADGQYVFWTATADGAIRRSSMTGGAVTTLATGQTSPYALAEHNANVYWAAKANGGLWRVSKQGGTPVKLADSLTGVVCILVDDTHVYWVDSSGLKRVPD